MRILVPALFLVANIVACSTGDDSTLNATKQKGKSGKQNQKIDDSDQIDGDGTPAMDLRLTCSAEGPSGGDSYLIEVKEGWTKANVHSKPAMLPTMTWTLIDDNAEADRTFLPPPTTGYRLTVDASETPDFGEHSFARIKLYSFDLVLGEGGHTLEESRLIIMIDTVSNDPGNRPIPRPFREEYQVTCSPSGND